MLTLNTMERRQGVAVIVVVLRKAGPALVMRRSFAMSAGVPPDPVDDISPDYSAYADHAVKQLGHTVSPLQAGCGRAVVGELQQRRTDVGCSARHPPRTLLIRSVTTSRRPDLVPPGKL